MQRAIFLKKSFCAILIALCTISHGYADTNPALIQEEQDPTMLSQALPAVASATEEALREGQDSLQMAGALEQMLRQDLAHKRSLDRVLEDLLLLMSGRALVVNNKHAVINNIKELKMFIGELSNEAFVNIDAASLDQMQYLSAAITKHISAALDNYMVEFPAFSIEQVFMRHAPRTASLNDLQTAMTTNDALLAAVVTKAKSAGLRWYNKAYRSLDAHVIQPCDTYNIHTRLGKGLLLGTFATYITYLSSGDLPWLRQGPLNLGWHFKTSTGNSLNMAYHNGGVDDTGVTHTAHPLTWLGNLEYYLWENGQGFLPAGVLMWATLKPALQKEAEAASTFCAKKILKMHNILKGGTYSEKPEQKFLVDPKVMFKDLVGLDHAKETLSFIVQYLQDPERFDRAKLTPEKGYLLTGPTRTGKSYIAEALCGEIKAMFKRTKKNPETFNFYSLSASFVLTEGIEAIVADAKRLAPCILFIDEIDLLGLQRAGGNPQLLSKFLSTMSGCLESDPEKVVIMIAATNKPENLDGALRQRGRFGKEIRFEYPTFKERKDYLTKRISSLANAEAFNLDQIARETEGKSFEDLNAMIKSAFQKGIIKGEILNQQQLDRCLDEEVRHIIMNDTAMPSTPEKELLAAHQAGHALAVLLLGGDYEKLSKVTIKPYLAALKEEAAWDQYYQSADQQQKKIKYGKVYTYHTHDIKNLHRLDDKVRQGKIQLAGFAAEEILLGACGYSYHEEDSHMTLEIAKSIVSQGLDLNQLTNELKNNYLDKALALKAQWAQEIHALLQEHKDLLSALARELSKHGTLTEKDVEVICSDVNQNKF